MSSKKGMGLGKGLNALIGGFEEIETVEKVDITNKVIDVDINKIEPNKHQPRKSFDEESLFEMAESMKNIGVIQPITVKKINNYFEIITGERRWRAARIAKLKTVPVIVKDYDELERLEVALIENIQRENLNPLEEAFTYKRFSDEFNLNQEAIASKVGKSRAVVANAMRLLNLDKRVQNFIVESKITNGHARALLAVEDSDMQFELAEKIIEEQLSVRQTEELVKKFNEAITHSVDNIVNKSSNNSEIYNSIANDIKTILGTKVNIKNGKNKGKIEIEYYSDDELDRLVCMFKKLQ